MQILVYAGINEEKKYSLFFRAVTLEKIYSAIQVMDIQKELLLDVLGRLTLTDVEYHLENHFKKNEI